MGYLRVPGPLLWGPLVPARILAASPARRSCFLSFNVTCASGIYLKGAELVLPSLEFPRDQLPILLVTA